jgi:hypothetical protein
MRSTTAQHPPPPPLPPFSIFPHLPLCSLVDQGVQIRPALRSHPQQRRINRGPPPPRASCCSGFPSRDLSREPGLRSGTPHGTPPDSHPPTLFPSPPPSFPPASSHEAKLCFARSWSAVYHLRP